MPGAGAMGPTLVNVSSGGRTSRSGVISGLFVVAMILLSIYLPMFTILSHIRT